MYLNTSNNFAPSSSSRRCRERNRNAVTSGIIVLPHRITEIGLLGFIEVFKCWWFLSWFGCNCV